ncbi:MAG: DUF2061 domain-containing protein [Candidatus Omnitrophica bacterium]|nr:DUF2061 domain-containing protein [Candidatus Omnitrophota bacterium]
METKRRSFVKALSWRFVATFITGGIVWMLTGEGQFAVKVGLLDTAIKLAAYFYHERVWNKIPYGKPREPEYTI